jgi:hypothetical protein
MLKGMAQRGHTVGKIITGFSPIDRDQNARARQAVYMASTNTLERF